MEGERLVISSYGEVREVVDQVAHVLSLSERKTIAHLLAIGQENLDRYEQWRRWRVAYFLMQVRDGGLMGFQWMDRPNSVWRAQTRIDRSLFERLSMVAFAEERSACQQAGVFLVWAVEDRRWFGERMVERWTSGFFREEKGGGPCR